MLKTIGYAIESVLAQTYIAIENNKYYIVLELALKIPENIMQ